MDIIKLLDIVSLVLNLLLVCVLIYLNLEISKLKSSGMSQETGNCTETSHHFEGFGMQDGKFFGTI